jgi:hypothetical protein
MNQGTLLIIGIIGLVASLQMVRKSSTALGIPPRIVKAAVGLAL